MTRDTEIKKRPLCWAEARGSEEAMRLNGDHEPEKRLQDWKEIMRLKKEPRKKEMKSKVTQSCKGK